MEMTIVVIWMSVLLTSTLSGVLGMGGGVILMFSLLSVLPVRDAMVLHGFVQLVANGARALTHREHIWWRCTGWYAFGCGIAIICLASIHWLPDHRAVYLLGGVIPLLQFTPIKQLQLDIAKRSHALVCGGLMTAGQISAGAAGPLLDAFFNQTGKGRYGIIATKSTTQVLSHLIKVTYFAVLGSHWCSNHGKTGLQGVTNDWTANTILADSSGAMILVGSLVFAVAVTRFGTRILARISEQRFARFSRLLLIALSAYSFSKVMSW